MGVHKMDFLVDKAGVGAVAMMRAIEQALDPQNILNPGKAAALQAQQKPESKRPLHLGVFQI